MKEEYNWKSIIVGFIVLIIGILMIPFDIYWVKSSIFLWGSIGCSLIASGLVILLNGFLADRLKISPLDEWGIKNIYHTRSRMNEDCDKSLNKAKYKVDVVAFGLKSFRTDQEKLTKKLLNKGVNFRIITMDPESPFVEQRAKEEDEPAEQIKNSIFQLIKWAEKLNKESKKGQIEIKGYACMTLDFYWRVDDDIYVGPYWYGYASQQTISYRFSRNENNGFRTYTDYFDRLWNNESIMKALVSKQSTTKRK